MSSSGAVSRLGTFQAFEPLERRLLLSGGAGQVAAIRWEDAAGHELADGQHVMPGAALFIAVDTVGMRGSDATVYLYEDDGPWCPDDFILPITVPVPPDGDTGRVEWRAAWHTDSDWGEEWNPIQDPAPEYRLWASQDVFEDVCTRLIELSTPALQWKTQTGQPLSADDVVEEGTFVCLSVDGLAFDAADTFTAAVWEDDWPVTDDDYVAGSIVLTHHAANEWRGAWQTYWTDDNLPGEMFTDNPDYYFVLDGFGLESDTIDVAFGASFGIPVRRHTAGTGVPLILIHGNNSDKHPDDLYRWATFVDYIAAHPQAFAEYDVYVWKHTTALPIGFTAAAMSQADALAQYIYGDLQVGVSGTAYADTQVMLVGHSQGGLVSRAFMNTWNDALGRLQGDDVMGLITLGTPHHGSPFAVPDWGAQVWEALYDNTLSDFLNFRLLIGPGGFAFNTSDAGSVNLAWSNQDGAVAGSTLTTFLVPYPEVYELTARDMNAASAVPDATVFYDDAFKAAYGTLADLNQRERYFDRIVAVSAYDESLAENKVGSEALGYLGLLAQDVALGLMDDHGALNIVTYILASMAASGGRNYAANDGLVPLQSALFLDIAGTPAFASVGPQQEVVLDTAAVAAARQVLRQYVFSGAADGIRDHLDLLDTDNGQYWDTLAGEIRSFLPSAQVLASHLFYDNSALDGLAPGPSAMDDDAIDATRHPLLPGEAPVAANRSAYARGINGLMIDVAGSIGEPAAADFLLEISDPSGAWTPAPAPAHLAVRVGAGTDRSDRVTATWADGAILNRWLRVTVLSDAAGGRLGLADNAVFLFGSLAGDADGSGGVDLDDFVLLKQNFGTAGSGIPSGDFDASGHVDLDDFVTLKQNFAASLGDPFPTAGIAGTADLLAAGAAAPRPVRARRPGRSAGSRRFRDASGALDLLSAITLRPLA